VIMRRMVDGMRERIFLISGQWMERKCSFNPFVVLILCIFDIIRHFHEVLAFLDREFCFVLILFMRLI